MKKNSTVKQSPKPAVSREVGPITIGMDLGDKTSRYCVLGGTGEVVGKAAWRPPKKGCCSSLGGCGGAGSR